MTAPSTLFTIRKKVRRLTGRTSNNKITDDQIDEYINTFVQYDLPQQIKLFSNETVFEFYTKPNTPEYNLRPPDPDNPSFSDLTVDFDGETVAAADVYTNFRVPCFVEGYRIPVVQDRQALYSYYPEVQVLTATTFGNNTNGPYTFSFGVPRTIPGTISVSTVDNTKSSVSAKDRQISITEGEWFLPNQDTTLTGIFNYETGTGEITFPNIIPTGESINASAAFGQQSRPYYLLYYDDKFVFRPVPDRAYSVRIGAYVIPSALLENTQDPKVKQWWQYIAYGAAKKIFEDSQDPEGEAAILPGLKEQEALAQRRTLVQYAQQRSPSIFQGAYDYPGGGWGNIGI